MYLQTYSYTRHFISTCVRVCGYETTTRGIDVEGHVAAVSHCPVGIDAERVTRDMWGILPFFSQLLVDWITIKSMMSRGDRANQMEFDLVNDQESSLNSKL